MAAGIDVDHAIVGAGVSGLCLAHFLSRAVPDASIAVVDRDDDPNYNISFWSVGDTPFEAVMSGAWRTIAVRYGDRTTICPLRRYVLRSFWRDDFDAHLMDDLQRRPNVRFEEVGAADLVDGPDSATVHTSAGAIRASWVYDSRSSVRAIREDDPGTMLMQGLAVEIECAEPVFDPEVATLFDFLVDSPQLDFMYVLPYTDRTALVNVAFLTPCDTAVTRETCEGVIAAYVAARLGCAEHRVTNSCYGRLPLASRYPARDPRSRIVPIGARAGMIKASTSYAFTRILSDAERMAASVGATGRPYYRRRRAWYYRWADKSTARVFAGAPKLAQELMFLMFSDSTGDLALSFLDERNTWSENRELFRSIPTPTVRRFLRQLGAAAVRGAA